MGSCASCGRRAQLTENRAESQLVLAGVQKSQTAVYSPLEFEGFVNKFQGTTWHLALVTWLVMPLYAVMQELVDPIKPSCEEGFRNVTLVFVVLYEAFHIYSEVLSWTTIKQLLSPPEVTILRGYGILSRRRRYVILGICESLDLYTDVCFPFIAHACSAHSTDIWNHSWRVVPIIGKPAAAIVTAFRFWGCCLFFACINVLITGLHGLFNMWQAEQLTKQHMAGENKQRISGEIFFMWARSAETAMMPSVAMLSEEIAIQQRYKYDANKNAADAFKARDNVVHGKLTAEKALQAENIRQEEEARVTAAGKMHYILLLLVKVLVGNAIQLWMQSAFFGLTFEVTGREAKVKIVISIILSTITALVRVKMIVPKMGLLGLFVGALILFIIVWSLAKVYFAYTCATHVWNLSSMSCVQMP